MCNNQAGNNVIQKRTFYRKVLSSTDLNVKTLKDYVRVVYFVRRARSFKEKDLKADLLVLTPTTI